MGLDVKAVSSIGERVASGWFEWEEKGGCQDADLIFVSPNLNFQDRAEGLRRGLYEREGSEYKFRAGSYTGYGRFRKHLSLAIHGIEPRTIWETPTLYKKDAPFFELIHFSDCEGVIGPKTSLKLYNDFKKHRQVFYAYVEERPIGQISDTYDNFTRAFGVASEMEKGIVMFY